MNGTTASLVVLALLGSALIGGVFFAFSSFVMKALARVPSTEGIAAMQSINIAVINPSFLGVFLGTAVLSLVVAVLALKAWGTLSAIFLLVGASFYFVGTFLVTLIGNVPLNNVLAEVMATSTEAAKVWEHYLNRWTMLNTIRTAAAAGAMLMYALSLLLSAAAGATA